MKHFSNCPICGKSRFSEVFNKKWHRSHFVRCRKCGLIFQNPQEPLDTTKKRYKDEYFKYEVENQHNFFNLVKKTIDDYGILSLLPENGHVLEIGSATGLFLQYMDRQGFSSTGIEICKESVDYGRSHFNVNLLHTTLEDARLESESFDFVHFSHLIEHLNNPRSFVAQIYTLLRKGGYIVVTTPNASGLFSNFYVENWRCIVDDHLFLFNKHNLRRLLVSEGFEITKELTWGSIPKGAALAPFKKTADKLVKVFGMGDVVSFLARKT